METGIGLSGLETVGDGSDKHAAFDGVYNVLRCVVAHMPVIMYVYVLYESEYPCISGVLAVVVEYPTYLLGIRGQLLRNVSSPSPFPRERSFSLWRHILQRNFDFGDKDVCQWT